MVVPSGVRLMEEPVLLCPMASTIAKSTLGVVIAMVTTVAAAAAMALDDYGSGGYGGGYGSRDSYSRDYENDYVTVV